MFSLKFFFFNDTATTEIYTLSLHDALPICIPLQPFTQRHNIQTEGIIGRNGDDGAAAQAKHSSGANHHMIDRKSTRLNSSHTVISYAVFCLKKKRTTLIGLGIFAKIHETNP